MIENMRVPEGYKRTEVGVIPDDWEVKRLGEMVDFTNGKAHEKSISDNGRYIVVNSKFISTEGEVVKYSDNCYCLASEGNILMVMSDLPNGKAIAKCFYVDKENKYTVNQRICLLKAHRVDSRFLYYKIDRHPYYLSFDDGVKQTNLRKEDVLNLELILPKDISEQQAIAEVLSDVDNLIASLEKLIDKKQKIKQGTMQELLTGKRRLPGFTGEWEVKRLGDITDIKTGKKNNEDKVEEGKYPFFVRSQKVERINSYAFDGEAVLIPGEGGIGSIYHYINGKFDYHQRVYKISNFEGVKGKYVYYSMMKNFSKHAMQYSVKATVDSLRLPAFQEFKVYAPKSLEEQYAIAEILSDMDSEIEALEEKLEKYKAIKEGMMQELLTGRIRLI